MSTAALNKALIKFHGALEGNIKKQSQAHQYKYADLGSTLDVIRDPLAAAELAVTQTTACYRDTSPPTSVLITTLRHASGEEISSEFYLDLEAQSLKNANPMQNAKDILASLVREKSALPQLPPSHSLRHLPQNLQRNWEIRDHLYRESCNRKTGRQAQACF